MRQEVRFHMFLKKMTPKLPRKRKMLSHCEEEEASKVLLKFPESASVGGDPKIRCS